MLRAVESSAVTESHAKSLENIYNRSVTFCHIHI